jgi:putative peptide zinc metalloprotease protein
LADLTNTDLDLEIANLVSKRNEQAAQLESRQRERYSNPLVASEIPGIEKVLAALNEQLTEKQGDSQRLHLVAPRAGQVIPPPNQAVPPANEGKLPMWSGSPLDEHNLGATLEHGKLFCQIGDPGKFEAVLYVDQADADQVFPGQKVKIMLGELPGITLTSEINEKSTDPSKYLPKALSNKAKGPIETKADESGIPRPASILYQARAPLDDENGELESGLLGEAKIDAPWHSLGWRLWRFLQRTFHFKL